MRIRLAQSSDAVALTTLINRSFAVERFFLEDDRIDLEGVSARLVSGEFLVLEEADPPVLLGCVYLEARGDRSYLGLLSIDPTRQKQGLSRRLMQAAEHHSLVRGRRLIELTVVNLRKELPSYYQHLGYQETGTSPFTPGIATKLPCHLIHMVKELA